MTSVRELRVTRPLDLELTLAPLRHGRGDPTIRVAGGDAVLASRTPEGPATLELRLRGDRLRALAWGPGASYALEHAGELCGEGDGGESFEPRGGVVGELHRRFGGVRIPRTSRVMEALIPAVLEQKVIGDQARRAYRAMIRALGEPAPGPFGLRLQPHPAVLAGTPYYVHHRFGVERRRADTLRRAAAVAARLEEAVRLPLELAYHRLTAVAGIGRWTAAEVAAVALGDADAVPVGDFHLPNVVSWNLARRPRGHDAEMLALLEPYRPHRGRVLRYLLLGGASPPAYAPRLALHDIRDL